VMLWEAVAKHLVDSTSATDLVLKVNATRGLTRQASTYSGTATFTQVLKAVPMAAHSLATTDGCPTYPEWWSKE